MSTHTYEGMFILDSNRYARESGAVIAHVNELLKRHGAVVQVSRLWEERRLAYPIEGHRKGTYWLTYFKLDAKNLSKLTRDFQLSDIILRQLTLKVDARIADALIEHAKAGAARPKSDEAPKTEGPPRNHLADADTAP